nr:hypothetical protein [Paracraurococcus ruber]
MQEGQRGERIRRARTAFEQGRRGDRHQLLPQPGMQREARRRRPGGVAHGQVEPLPRQVDEPRLRHRHDRHPRMRGLEARQARQQPARAEGRVDADSHGAAALPARTVAAQLPRRAEQQGERLRRRRMQPPPGRRQRHPARLPQEERDAEVAFQRRHLPADGAGRAVQHCRGGGEGPEPRRGVEGLQRIHGRRAEAGTLAHRSQLW